MAERSQHRASEGQDAGSRAAPGDRKPEPTPGRRRRRESRMAAASVRRWAWAAPSRRGMLVQVDNLHLRGQFRLKCEPHTDRVYSDHPGTQELR